MDGDKPVVLALDRRPQYFALFILSVVIASSLYMSWAADTGMGDLIVNRYEITGDSGRQVHFMVYKPRDNIYPGPMPVILTTHGVAGSKAGMYSFNIELARRNFTVVSVDLPGHGDSPEAFVIDDIHGMAEDCYSALRYVQTTFPNIDNETYGMLTHSLGFQVALVMSEFPIAPSAYAAVGYLQEMGLDLVDVTPGNLLLALGQFDEMITAEMAIESLRMMTGNSTAEPGITYGSFENQTAYRLDLAPTDHVFEAIDGTIVAATSDWMVRAIQGETQWNNTIAPTDQVYAAKTIAMATGVFALLVSTIPLLVILQDIIPDKMKPRRIPIETEPATIKKTIMTSSIIGAAIIIFFTIGSASAFHLENMGIFWPNSMFMIGIVIFFLLSAVGIPLILLIANGKDNLMNSFKSIGIDRSNLKLLGIDLTKSALIAIIGIAWLIGWMALGGTPEMMRSWVIFSMVRYPVGIRVQNIAALFLVALPYFAMDAAWIRGFIISNRQWSGGKQNTKNLILSFATRLAAAGGLSVAVVSISTIMGFIAGEMVLLGLLLLLYMIISTLTTILISWTSVEFDNPWPAVLLSAFMLAWILISSVPLI